MLRRECRWLVFAVGLGIMLSLGMPAVSQREEPESLAPFVPTPMKVVRAMLKLANVTKDDVVYDLGCGDGRIVIEAAKRFGAHGVGVDIDPQRIRESNENAQRRGVTDRVEFRLEDAMKTDLTKATVVTMYLLTEANLKLRPKLFRELKPGTRVVSHAFAMGDWEADKVIHVQAGYSRTVYFWMIPARVGGIWQWTEETSHGAVQCVLRVQQEFQKVKGVVTIGERSVPITNAKLVGRELTFSIAPMPDRDVVVTYQGVVNGNIIRGVRIVRDAKQPWQAKRMPVKLDGLWRWKVMTPDGEIGAGLRILHDQKGIIKMAYVSDGKETTLWESYAWGANIRFSVNVDTPRGKRMLTFRGFVEGDKITGSISCTQWDEDADWVAHRVK